MDGVLRHGQKVVFDPSPDLAVFELATDIVHDFARFFFQRYLLVDSEGVVTLDDQLGFRVLPGNNVVVGSILQIGQVRLRLR